MNSSNRVAIYVATFTPIVDMDDSVEAQREYCKAVVASACPNYIVVAVYQDEVRSWDAKRPSFEQMIFDAQGDKFDFIAVMDLKYLDHELMETIDTPVLKIPKLPKKKTEKNKPRQIKWIPDSQILSFMDVISKKKTMQEHLDEFGSDENGPNDK